MAMDALWRVLLGDARTTLTALPACSVQACVTSPPYWRLRDYGVAGQLGQEATPDDYVAALVGFFRGVRRVLRDDGVLWLNLGDAYNTRRGDDGLTTGDLLGLPWRTAFGLQWDGWVLRSEVIWSKPNPRPESVKNRPTRSHEQVFLLTKQESYFYDADAVREPFGAYSQDVLRRAAGRTYSRRGDNFNKERRHRGGIGTPATRAERVSLLNPLGRNKRTVWTVQASPYRGAHYATFPEALVEPCILAGSRRGDTVLDPFAGSGTVGVVALKHGRRFIGCDISASSVALASQRLADVTPRLSLGA